MASSRDDTESGDSSSEEDEERLLSRGLVHVYLERVIKGVLKTPLQQEFLVKIGIRVPKDLQLQPLLKTVMNKVYQMEDLDLTTVLKNGMIWRLMADRERAKWYTSKLLGESLVTSPRGRTKIGNHIEHKLSGSVEVSVDRYDEGLWLVLFERAQLQKLSEARSKPTITLTAFVWFPGEPALYSNRARPAKRVLEAVSTALGFAEARPIRLYGRRLSSMRLMFTAKTTRQFFETDLPEDDYPLLV